MWCFAWIEWAQSRRSMLWTFVWLLALGVAAKLVLGPFAIGIALLVALVSVPTSLGAGTWSEEFTTGAARFLYTLPVNRHAMWWIKLASGLGSSIVFAAVVMAAVLFTPSLIHTLDAQDSLLSFMQTRYGLGPIATLLSFGGPALLISYAIGLLVGVTVSSPKALRIVLTVVTIVAVIGVSTIGTLLFVLGIAPGPVGVAVVGVCVFAILLAGAYLVFLQRNPYDDRPLRWWPWSIGSVAMAFVALVVGGVTAGIVAPGPWSGGLTATSVVRLDPSPDGRHVAGWTTQLLGVSGIQLFDAYGNRLHNVPEVMQPAVVAGASPWQSHHGRTLLFCYRPSIVNGQTAFSIVAIDIDTGETLNFPWTAEASATHQFLAWDPDARRLYTARLEYGEDGPSVMHVSGRPDQPAADTTQQLGAFDSNWAVGTYSAGEGRVILEASNYGDGASGDTEYRIYDAQGEFITTYRAPDDLEAAWVVPDRPGLLALQRHIDGDRVERSLQYRDLLTGEGRTFLERNDFESFSVSDALSGRPPFAWVDLIPAFGRPCVLVRTAVNGAHESVLIDLDNNRRRVFRDDDVGLGDEQTGHLSIGSSVSAGGRRLLRVASEFDDDTERWRYRLAVYRIDDDAPPYTMAYESAGPFSPVWLGDDSLLFLAFDDGFGDAPPRLMQIDLTASHPTPQPWGPPETSGVDGPTGPAW